MMNKAEKAMRTSVEALGMDKHFVTTSTTSVAEQKEVIERLEREKQSTMHNIAKCAASFGAGIAVEAGVIHTTFAFGNGISQALTGENLHGVGLVATAATASVLGIGTGTRTAFAVQDGFNMVDEWRLEKANAHLKVLEELESDLESDEDDAE